MCCKNHFCEDCLKHAEISMKRTNPGHQTAFQSKWKYIVMNAVCETWSMIDLIKIVQLWIRSVPDVGASLLGFSFQLLIAFHLSLPALFCLEAFALHVLQARCALTMPCMSYITGGKQLGMWKSKQTNSTPHPNTSWKIYLEPREWLMTQRNVALLPSWTNTQFMEKASAIPLHGKQQKGIMNNRFQSLQSSSTRNLCPVQNFIKSKGECIHQISSSCSVVPCAGPNTTKCFVKLNKGVARTK